MEQQNKQTRLLLAFAVSFMMIYIYQTYFAPPPPQVPAPAQTEQTGQKDAAATKDGQAKSGADKNADKTQAAAPAEKNASAAGSLSVDPSENGNKPYEFAVTTDRYHAIFDTLGGRVKAFYMRKFEQDGRLFDFHKSSRSHMLEINGKDEPVIEMTEGRGMDFQLFLHDTELSAPSLNKAVFRKLDSPSDKEVHFAVKLRTAGGVVEFIKKFVFLPGENFFTFSYELNNLSQDGVKFADSNNRYYLKYLNMIGPLRTVKNKEGKEELAEISSFEMGNFFNFYYMDDSLEKLPSVHGEESMMCSGPTPTFTNHPVFVDEAGVNYIGSSSKYFATILNVVSQHDAMGVLHHTTETEMGLVAFAFRGHELTPAGQSGQAAGKEFLVYLGIRDMDMVAVNDDKMADKYLQPLKSDTRIKMLKSAFDVSTFLAPFRDAIMTIIRLLYKVIPNYGMVIIVFAILFKLAFYPLNQKQAASMKKMQKIQPLMKEINKKYANNAQEKQKRIMELYKTHKINPVAGCLPMLIQMPIFIALYGAFGTSVELWGASFDGVWIKDLSLPDTITTLTVSGSTFNINALPLIMTISQILQTKMTPMSGDASQQKIMMYMMPAVVLLFLWNMPSGLTLYWTISNFLTIGQQILVNKSLEDA